MKPVTRLILASSLALAATGCDDAKVKAESIGIIGGEDGRVQALYGAVVKNGMCRDAGEAYVDPSEYTNSADFIMALSRPIEEMYE